MTQKTGNIRENILFALKSADPLILLLDNFETPWNATDGRSEAEQTLRDIDQFQHITFFITMRSSMPPCGELVWRLVDLKAVNVEAAYQIYSKIYPESSVDRQVPELLELVGHMPLAITLMATSAKLSRLSAKDLIDQYKKTGPTMLSQGFDREHNMNICIGLSVDSLPMKRSPEAQWLLAALSMLPVGTTYNMLNTWYARGLSNLTGALQILRDTSLVELQTSTFCVLPVIQRYVVDPSRFDMNVRNSIITSACEFLEKHKSAPGDNSHKENIAVLATEEGNLEAILLQTVAPSAEVLNALLVLAEYQAIARPRTNIVAHALTFAQQMGDKSIHGAVLSCYGSICFTLNRYEESRKHYTDAREVFLSISDTKQAAHCLLACIESHQVDRAVSGAIQTSLAIQAESEFQSTNDIHGVARCWQIRGHTASRTGNCDEALSLLQRAHHKFTELDDSLGSARCSGSISFCYYNLGDFEHAKTWAESALQEFGRVGPTSDDVDVLLVLAVIYNALGTHAAALQASIQCLEKSKVSAGHLEMGLALEAMGIAWMQMGKKDDARDAFQEAMEVYPSIPNRPDDRVRCRYWLKKVEDSSTIPTLEEQHALDLDYPSTVLSLYGVKRG